MTHDDYEHAGAAAFQQAVREVCPGIVRIRVSLDSAAVEDDFDFAVALDTQPAGAECRARYTAAVVSSWRELLAATCPHATIAVCRGTELQMHFETSELSYDLTPEEVWIAIANAVDFHAWENVNLSAFAKTQERAPEQLPQGVSAALDHAASRLLRRMARFR